MHILFSFSNKCGLMGVHIRASFTGCANVINALSTWHHTQITQDNARQQCSVLLSSGCGLGRRYAAMHSDGKWLLNQPVSDMLKVYTINDEAHGFKTQHFTHSSKAIHYTPVGFFKQCATPKVMLTPGAT